MYSQNSEDEIISRYFGDFKGTLLDAGANDGVTFSNSRYLMLKGWTGFLFEPASVCSDLFILYNSNPKAHIYNLGISAYETTEALFFESGAHVPNGTDLALVSSFDHTEVVRWRGVEFKERFANILSFIKWWESADMPILDFITIDIEGMDWKLLQAIDLAKVGCRCLCIEWNSKPDMGKLYTEYCNSYGLYEIHRNAENIIYAL